MFWRWVVPVDVDAIQTEFSFHGVHKGKDGMVYVNFSTIHPIEGVHAIPTVIK